MEDNKKKNALNEEELMGVSGGTSSSAEDRFICPKCGERTELVPVYDETRLKYTCSACGHIWYRSF